MRSARLRRRTARPSTDFRPSHPCTRKSSSSPAPDRRCRKSGCDPSHPFFPAVRDAPACSPRAAPKSVHSSSATPPPSVPPPEPLPYPSPCVHRCPPRLPKCPPTGRHPRSAGSALRPSAYPQSSFHVSRGPTPSQPDLPRRGPVVAPRPSDCRPLAHRVPPRLCTAVRRQFSPCTDPVRAAILPFRSPPRRQSHSVHPWRTGWSPRAGPPRCPLPETAPSARVSRVPLFPRCTTSALRRVRPRRSQWFRPFPPGPWFCALPPRPLHRRDAGRQIPSFAPRRLRRFPPHAKTQDSIALPSVTPSAVAYLRPNFLSSSIPRPELLSGPPSPISFAPERGIPLRPFAFMAWA